MNNLLNYHNAEEAIISVACLFAAYITAVRHKKTSDMLFFMIAEGFIILSLSSFIHFMGHFLGEIRQLLYGSLIGYSIGFSSMLAAPFINRKSRAGRYIPAVLFLTVNTLFLFSTFIVDFFKTRFSLWMPVSFFSSLLAVIYFSEYVKYKKNHIGALTIGFFLISFSAVFLFFPADIRSFSWTAGHILRPVGYLMLALGFSMRWK